MADFTVIVASGAVVRDWLDPAAGSGAPSRLNSLAGHPQKMVVGARNVPVVLKAVVAGVVGPPDTALGGRLFTAWAVEAPAIPFAGINSLPGESSVQYVVAAAVGHYTIGFRRPGGGIEHIHLEIA